MYLIELAYELDILVFISAGNLDKQDIEQIELERRGPNTDGFIQDFLKYPHHFYDPFYKDRVILRFIVCEYYKYK